MQATLSIPIASELSNSNKLVWQTLLAEAITEPADLLQRLGLNTDLLPAAVQAARTFKLRVPQGFAALMRYGDSRDPLLRQVLPLQQELWLDANYSTDPVGEQAVNPLPGLLHKYQGRVLLTVTGACGINCRYCFRRHFPYTDNNPGRQGWEKALEYIASDASIHEVILSGGDPLLATDKTLADLSNALCAIPHVKTLRIHSRMPIVLPERIDDHFLNWFSQLSLRKVLVTHCNHPQELTADIKMRMNMLRQGNVTLLNQSVLLKDVNDNAETLIALSETLFDFGILPYYLHALDKVQGAAHFAVDNSTAKQIMQTLMQQLPGYLVPKFVVEQAGAAFKVPVEFA